VRVPFCLPGWSWLGELGVLMLAILSKDRVCFYRTKKLDQVREILTHPEIYPHMGDDFTPPSSRFEVNRHDDIWYVMVRSPDFWDVMGVFTFIPQNRVCWEIHVALLPGLQARDKWAAARQIVPWLGQNTECKRLTASVPACNRPAIFYGMIGIGMELVGRHPRAFMKDGELQDLILLGTSVGGTSCRVY
jgi:hypothetical protein